MMYASLDSFKSTGELASANLLDKWMISRVNFLIDDVTKSLDSYDISVATRSLADFMEDLSNWYIRRSRKRFWKSEDDGDKLAAYETLYYSLTTYIKLLAPFMPFVTEEIYQGLVASVDPVAPKSIHLTEWPKYEPGLIDQKIEDQMEVIRKIVEAGLATRNENGIKVRQPLTRLTVKSNVGDLPKDLEDIILEEVNVKEIKFLKSADFSVDLDIKITKELKAEGIARDFVRFIQDGRKKAGFNIEDRITTIWHSEDDEVAGSIRSQANYIAKETLSTNFSQGEASGEYVETVKLDGEKVAFGISRLE